MRTRRDYLTFLTAGVTAVVAGCTDGGTDAATDEETAGGGTTTDTLTPTATLMPTATTTDATVTATPRTTDGATTTDGTTTETAATTTTDTTTTDGTTTPPTASLPPDVEADDARLTADDGDADDSFGTAIALDGSTALVGADSDEDPNGTNAGAVYVFERADGSWSQADKFAAGDSFDGFGTSVALDGETALVGAPDASTTKVNNTGAAYVFDGSGDSWTQESKLTADDAAAYDGFGQSVDLDGTTALVGANGANEPDDAEGAAYVFDGSGDSWTQQSKLTADDGDTIDNFGWSVALAGDTTLVGAYLDEDPNGTRSGSAYVFARSDGSWSQQSKLAGDDGAAHDSFGATVALDDDTALVGAPEHDAGANDTGAAYVFTRAAGTWDQQSKLVADDGDSNDRFGEAVALDGATALVGAYNDEDPNGTEADELYTGAGSAYVFARRRGDWSQTAKLAARDGDANDSLGGATALDGETALVGAAGEDIESESGESFDGAGSAYAYEV